jgi:hypothetical protein
VSPNSGKEAEWYWTPEYRVTRFGDDKVVGYVEYGQQTSDPYLTSVVPPLSGSPYDSDMCIDYSLQFAIDDFGEGNYRAPPQNNSVNYDGSLDEFPTFYATIGIPEFPNLLLLMAVVLLVCTASALLFKTRFKGNRKFVNIQV